MPYSLINRHEGFGKETVPSGTLVPSYQIARRHVSQNGNLHRHSHNLAYEHICYQDQRLR